MKTRTTSIILAALAAVLMLPAAAKADSFVLSPITTPGSPAIVVAGGGATTFMGTLMNDSSNTWFLTGTSSTLAVVGVSIDDTPFFVNTPLSLTAGASVGPVAFFNILAAPGTTPGVYAGSFSVLIGDASGNILFDLTEQFYIQVVSGTQPIPEPATMFLLGSGLAGLAAARRRKRHQAQAS